MLISCFEPIIFENSKILILGSAPSVASLQKKEYYGNPQNRFWKVLFRLFDIPFSQNYTEKIELIRTNNLAVFDVIKTCERSGSLDADIKQARPNDLKMLLQTHPNISTVVLNGSLAKNLYFKYFSDVAIHTLPLPSTSPIPRKDIRNFDDLYEKWRELKKYI